MLGGRLKAAVEGHTNPGGHEVHGAESHPQGHRHSGCVLLGKRT